MSTSFLGLSQETHKKILEKYGAEDKDWQVSSDYAIVQSHFMSKQ